MKKISEIIEQVIVTQPFLEEALAFGFLNLTAFAEYIRPYIERESQKSLSVHAIKMALSRMEKPKNIREKIPKRSFHNMSTRIGLSIMTLPRSSKSVEIVTGCMIETRRKNDHFFTMIEGIHEIDIIYETSIHQHLLWQIPVSLQLLCVPDLALISIDLSDIEISTPWLFYSITKQLAFHNINIIQVLSTYHEFGIIVSVSNLKHAVSVLMS